MTIDGAIQFTGGFWRSVMIFALGDLNCDGSTNPFDVDPFVPLLTGG